MLGKQMTTDARRLMRLRAVTSKEHSVVRLLTGMAKGFVLGLPSLEPRVGPQQGRPYEGSSRMRGNSHVRFLGGRGRAIARAYPAHRVGYRSGRGAPKGCGDRWQEALMPKGQQGTQGQEL